MEYPSLEIRGLTVAQFPNPPLAVALVAGLVGRLTEDTTKDISTSVFYIALAIWAYEEATDGANWFRRILGLAGIIFVLVMLARDLGR